MGKFQLQPNIGLPKQPGESQVKIKMKLPNTINKEKIKEWTLQLTIFLPKKKTGKY